jgi:hypothetical protein
MDTMDDNKLMQEHSGTGHANEARSGIASPQNYGHTSVNMPADKDGSGKPISGSETHYSYQGGNRSHPVPGPIDDRRHRLRGLSPGDSAMHRTKDDDQQFHMTQDGNINSASSSKKIRNQLVPPGSGKANPPQSKAQASQAKQILYAMFDPRIEARLWAGLEPDLELELDQELERLGLVEPRAGNGGGGSSGGGGQQSQGNKPTGQKAVAGAGEDSKDFHELKSADHRVSSGTKVSLASSKEDSDVLHQTRDAKDYCGGTPDAHTFKKVLTTAGPAKNVYGRIG